MEKIVDIVFSFKARSLEASRDGLVGYDAALTQLRSGVRFSPSVFFPLQILEKLKGV